MVVTEGKCEESNHTRYRKVPSVRGMAWRRLRTTRKHGEYHKQEARLQTTMILQNGAGERIAEICMSQETHK